MLVYMEEKPFIFMCDNCGEENPPLVNPDDPRSRLTACCGYGITHNWKDGWGKRTKLIGQAVIDEWRKAKKSLIASGDLPISLYSQKGHYEI